jgi:hypothetical protein
MSISDDFDAAEYSKGGSSTTSTNSGSSRKSGVPGR